MPSDFVKQGFRALHAASDMCSGLQAVQRTLVLAQQSATSGHVHLLKQKALKAVLRRLDATLFDSLIAGEHAAEHPTLAGTLRPDAEGVCL